MVAEPDNQKTLMLWYAKVNLIQLRVSLLTKLQSALQILPKNKIITMIK